MYSYVSREVFEDFMDAPSKGSFYYDFKMSYDYPEVILVIIIALSLLVCLFYLIRASYRVHLLFKKYKKSQITATEGE